MIKPKNDQRVAGTVCVSCGCPGMRFSEGEEHWFLRCESCGYAVEDSREIEDDGWEDLILRASRPLDVQQEERDKEIIEHAMNRVRNAVQFANIRFEQIGYKKRAVYALIGRRVDRGELEMPVPPDISAVREQWKTLDRFKRCETEVRDKVCAAFFQAFIEREVRGEEATSEEKI